MRSHPAFSNPQHFSKEANHRWTCNLCGRWWNVKAAAVGHEQDPTHLQRIAEAEASAMWSAHTTDLAAWNAPLDESPPLTKEERLVREHQDHFELTALIIPHWLSSVAEGNDMHLESFLDAIDDKTWSKRTLAAEHSAVSGSQTGSRTEDGTGWAFVEEIATEEAADASKKERLHEFYDMPTDAKVKRIEEVIRSLRAS
uniref:C2H2-type domain-containing protein n=1 Tax=Mycena chlorophos TaxID=658473 RepID=A0ABQ0KYV7_MYCCL|nr:predicted protein [Mycena chlorophos]